MAPRTKPPSTAAPSPAPPAAAAEPAPPTPAAEPDTAPKYTWAQLDAALPAASADDRAAFDVSLPPAQLQARGATIASARLLTDAQRWLGQLVDFERSVANPGAVVLGYRPALARVFADYTRTLRGLVGDQTLSAADLKLRRSSAEKDLQRVVRDARLRYETVRASLHAATRADAELHDRVSAMPARPGQTVLSAQLTLLASLLTEALKRPKAMQVRLAGRGLDRAVAQGLRSTADAVTTALDRTLGGTPNRAASQSQIDLADGALVTLMEELMQLFPRGRREGVPVLVPLASRTFFTANRYRRAPTPPDA